MRLVGCQKDFRVCDNVWPVIFIFACMLTIHKSAIFWQKPVIFSKITSWLHGALSHVSNDPKFFAINGTELKIKGSSGQFRSVNRTSVLAVYRNTGNE